MKCRYLLSTLLLASVVGCVAHVSPNANLKTQIVVDPLTPKDALAPWLMYGEHVRTGWKRSFSSKTLGRRHTDTLFLRR